MSVSIGTILVANMTSRDTSPRDDAITPDGPHRDTGDAMTEPVRVMIERGKKKRVVAAAFDWPGWDRSGKTEGEALDVLDRYRPRYAKVAVLAGHGDEFGALGAPEVVEDVPGIGMTDFYGLSGVPATPEKEPMTPAECDRKVALLEATWAYFDATAARVSAELRKGPRGGGREKEVIVRHVVGWEIYDLAKKVGVVEPVDTREDPVALAAYRRAFAAAIRDYNAQGLMARSWYLQFLIRRCAWHMLDHAWELEDRDLGDA
jgi:hypothetical protein